jgi:hypothetical protein
LGTKKPQEDSKPFANGAASILRLFKNPKVLKKNAPKNWLTNSNRLNVQGKQGVLIIILI